MAIVVATPWRDGPRQRALQRFGHVQFNDIDLPQGAFTTTLVTGRVNYFLNTKVFLNALLQYNTDARQWSPTPVNVIHRPLSDIFLVYNERRESQTGNLLDRALVAKVTYLIAFVSYYRITGARIRNGPRRSLRSSHRFLSSTSPYQHTTSPRLQRRSPTAATRFIALVT